MSFSMRAQREANQHASLSNKFGLCHLSARYCNIGYSFSSMDDCSLKTMQLRGFHPAFFMSPQKMTCQIFHSWDEGGKEMCGAERVHGTFK